MSRIARAWFTLLIVGICGSTSAQETQSVRPKTALDTELAKAFVLAGSDRNRVIKDTLRGIALDNVSVANDLLKLAGARTSVLGRLFEDTNIELKVFESEEEGESASLGFAYDYAKDVRKQLVSEGARFSGIRGSFFARGNVAFESSKNPKNFLQTKLGLGYFSSWGGVVGAPEEEEDPDALNDREDALAKMKTIEDIEHSQEWAEFSAMIGARLTDQYYLGIDFNGGLESDQRFEQTQWTAGIFASLVPRGWGPNSFLGKINLFDYLPALTRVLTGTDEDFSPSGVGFPTLHVGFDRVMPQDEDPRALSGDDSDFWRYSIEVTLSSLLGRWNGDAVILESNLRHYAEVDPNQSVEDVNADKYTYFVTAVRMPNGMFVSYSTGNLPFDTRSDRVYEIGFAHQF